MELSNWGPVDPANGSSVKRLNPVVDREFQCPSRASEFEESELVGDGSIGGVP